MQKIIGIFDSGVGGITMLPDLQRVLTNTNIYYYGDSKNCPYGERTQDDLIEITTGIVQRLKEHGATLIVIACNTATTQCIHALRKKFPELTFVGAEPAIKVARDAGCKNILVMATPTTVESKQVKRLLDKYITDQKVKLLPCAGLAELVEQNVKVGEKTAELKVNRAIKKKLKELLADLPERSQIDGVVLGCTHYVYLTGLIQKYFPKAKVVDGNAGVAKRVAELLKK